MKKDILKSYHITGAIFIGAAICLLVFTQDWLLALIGLWLGYEYIDNGIQHDKNYEKKCCKGDCIENNQSATPGNDGESQERD